MDYSLLIGIHDSIKGNKDNIRDTTLSVFDPKANTLVRNTSQLNRAKKAEAMRQVLANSDLQQLGPSSSQLPDYAPPE